MGCNYCSQLEEYNFGDFLWESNYWIVFLAPNQSNIGTCVVALKRRVKFLSNVTPEEWSDFIQLVNKLEKALKDAFDATMFNWGTLMNTFYLEDTPDPHMHWHFIPRYDHEVEFNGEIFQDPFFGYMRPRPPKKISNSLRMKIREKIRENF